MLMVSRIVRPACADESQSAVHWANQRSLWVMVRLKACPHSPSIMYSVQRPQPLALGTSWCLMPADGSCVLSTSWYALQQCSCTLAGLLMQATQAS